MVGFLLVHRAGSHLYLTAFGAEGFRVGYIASLPFVFAASISVIALGLAVLALVRLGRVADEGMPVAVPTAVGVAGCLPGVLGLEPGPWFAVVAGLAYAASFAVLNFSWYELLAREGALEGTISLSVSILGSSLLASALADLAAPVLYALDGLFLVLGAATLAFLRRTAPRDVGGLSAGSSSVVTRGAVAAFMPAVATLAVFEMTVGTLNVTALNGYSEVMGSVPMWMSTAMGAGAFLAILLVAKAPGSSEFIYLRLFPVIMAVLGGCVVAGEGLRVATGVVMLVAYNLFTFSVAYTMFGLCGESRACPYGLVAVNLVVIKAALTVGLGVGLLIMGFEGWAPLTTAAVFAIYVLAMAAVVAQRASGRKGVPSSPGTAGRDMRPADVFARAHGFTPRESEVFLLLARGWGARQIAGELSVSENTVWSHVKHIYAKLGVQSKQEAINMWEAELGETPPAG